jgi:hypothetical protein
VQSDAAYICPQVNRHGFRYRSHSSEQTHYAFLSGSRAASPSWQMCVNVCLLHLYCNISKNFYTSLTSTYLLYIYASSNDATSNSNSLALSGWVVNNDLERLWREYLASICLQDLTNTIQALSDHILPPNQDFNPGKTQI